MKWNTNREKKGKQHKTRYNEKRSKETLKIISKTPT